MQYSAADTTEASAHRRDGISRRAVLATAIAPVVGTASCSWAEDDEGYDRSDHEMTFDLECVDPAAGKYVVRLTWEWADGANGSAPRDVVLIYWDANRWEWTGDGGETTDAVAYDSWYSDTERRSRVKFLHHDTAADAGREYAAGYRLSTVGDVAPADRSVFGAYAHRTRPPREGTRYRPDYEKGTGWTAEEATWTRTAESGQTAAACPEEGT
ncbi:hypothetical protein BRD02_02015 [Halobacteriales archaeon QS_8_69_73]|nr:MAG: hypothetical protein BRD02_02015 [Halobacteriales archaeon QS_8_69_73]